MADGDRTEDRAATDPQSVATAEALWDDIARYLEAEGLELDDLEVVGRGRGRQIKVVVDAPGGVDVERLADTSRGLSRLLDRRDPIEGSYTLEVTSPGLERKLRRPAHYRKSVGREVVVKTAEPVDDEVNHRGELTEADDEGFIIATAGGERRVAYGQVESARTVFRWEPAERGRGQKGRKGQKGRR